jgi:hydrogenase expression/formation protein HypC
MKIQPKLKEQSWNFSEGCQTCQAIPGKIVSFSLESADCALIDVVGTQCEIDVRLINDEHPACGDWVLVHAGVALCKLTEDEAFSQLRVLGTLDPNEGFKGICGSGRFGEDNPPRPPKWESGDA